MGLTFTLKGFNPFAQGIALRLQMYRFLEFERDYS
jgi:hypothetical protein